MDYNELIYEALKQIMNQKIQENKHLEKIADNINTTASVLTVIFFFTIYELFKHNLL